MNKLLPLLFCLYMFGAGHLNAQNGAAVQMVPVDGYSPTVYFNQFYNSYYDAKRGHLYFHTRDSLFRWDFTDWKWSFVRAVKFPEAQMVMDIDTFNDRVLIWSGGVGLMYQAKPDWSEDIVRIDDSFSHRSQFEHGHMISPIDGRLMVFGGYGFWQDRDIFTYYDDVKDQWDIQAWNSDVWPSKRVAPTLNYWERENKIVLFGGRTTTEPNKPYVTFRRTIYDIWTFDLEKQTWQLHGEMSVDRGSLTFSEMMLGYLVTPRNALWQEEDLLIGMDYYNSNDRGGIMYAVDLREMQGSFLEVPTGALVKYNRLLSYFLNEDTREIYLLWAPSLNNNTTSPVFISSIALPPADTIRANIQRMVELAENGWVAKSPTDGALFVVPIILAAAALPIVFWRYRRRGRQPKGLTIHTPDLVVDDTLNHLILIDAKNPVCSIRFRGLDVSSNFSSDEIDLLCLLARQYSSQNKFISTDQIEQALWDPGTNPDYSRKMRNQVQRKLEDNLQLNFPKSDGTAWLLNRNEPSDKRRKEYALNPDPYIVRIGDQD